MDEGRSGQSAHHGARLDSWKDIAAFFGRDVRTVRRWETDRGLPVRRVPGHARGRVFAYSSDLKAWLDTASVEPEGWAEPPDASSSHQVGGDAEVAPDAGEAGATSTALASGAHVAAASLPHATARRATQSWRWAAAAVVLLVSVAGAVLWMGNLGRPTVASHHVPPAAAQDLYLRGRYALSLRTEASLNDAVALFQSALASDPAYAAAYAGLADSHILMRQFGNVPDAEAFAKALAANEHAVALDPRSVEALRTHAFLLNWWMWDFPAAQREFLHAIALDPLDVQSHHWYATTLYSAGHFSEALAEIDIARRLQPDAVAVLANRGLLLAAVNRPSALKELLQLERMNQGVPTIHRYLGLVHFALGQPQAAIGEMRQAASLHGDTEAVAVIDRAAAALTQNGERAMLRTMGEGLGRMADRLVIDPLKPAYYYARLGDTERTLHFLTLACDRHQADFIEVRTSPVYAFLRGNPGYDALQRRAGIVSG